MDEDRLKRGFVIAYVPGSRSKLDKYSGIGTAYVPGSRSKLDKYSGIGTAYVPGPRSKLDKYSGIGTAYVPGPRSKLDKYSGIGTAYVPGPRSKLDKYSGIGTAYVPGPRSKLDRYPICSVFEFTDKLIGKKDGKEDVYKIPNHKDVLTEQIDDFEYDNALTRVRTEINELLNEFFKGNLKIEPSDGIAPSISSECPSHRKYELEVFDTDINDFQYILIYSNGSIILALGNIPFEKIVTVLKREAKWED